MINFRLFLFYIFSVANGEPPIGIPWETFQKFAKITCYIMKRNIVSGTEAKL